MGVTVEVSSLEEMCDMMCNNKLPEEKEEEMMKNPCENCKRKPSCPRPCYTLRDYNRALYKKGRNKTNGTNSVKYVRRH